jgi:hypothetical protein
VRGESQSCLGIKQGIQPSPSLKHLIRLVDAIIAGTAMISIVWRRQRAIPVESEIYAFDAPIRSTMVEPWIGSVVVVVRKERSDQQS